MPFRDIIKHLVQSKFHSIDVTMYHLIPITVVFCAFVGTGLCLEDTVAADFSAQTSDRRAFLRYPPIIDIAPIVETSSFSDADRDAVQQKILDAAHHWGFFQVLNHGIDEDLQQSLTTQMQLFFNSPQEVKYTIKRTENNSRGFADDELTKRLKDVKEILDIGQV